MSDPTDKLSAQGPIGELMEPLAHANTPSIAPQSVELPPMVLARWRLGRLIGAITHGRPAVVVLVITYLFIIGYLASLRFPDDPSRSPTPAAGANPESAPSLQGETALVRALPPSGSAPLTDQRDAADETDRPVSFPKIAAPAAPNALPNLPFGPTPQAQSAMIPEGAAPVAADLPAVAPVRVVLTFARNDAARAERAAAIRQALVAAHVEVADLVAVDAQRPRPGIGYYFRSDRDAAVGVSRRLEPLLGAVGPVVLQLQGRVPPGTIEIAVP